MVCSNIKFYFSKKSYPVVGDYADKTIENRFDFECNLLNYAYLTSDAGIKNNKYVNFLYYLGTGPNGSNLTG